MECKLLSVLLIYPRIFFCLLIVYRLLVGLLFVLLYSAICSCVLVVLVKLSVLAKWLALERPSDDTFMRWGDYLHKAQVEESVYVNFFFCLVCLCCYVFSPAVHKIYFIRDTPIARYSLYVLKVPLNTNKSNQFRPLLLIPVKVYNYCFCFCSTVLCFIVNTGWVGLQKNYRIPLSRGPFLSPVNITRNIKKHLWRKN